MANTYTQIYLHVVFAVQNRACVIGKSWQEDLHRYINGIVTKKSQKLMSINSMPDHVHLLLGLKPDIAPSKLIGEIKTGSTNHINEQRWIGCRFSWQEGFGAFSVSHSGVPAVIRYIQDQQAHHQTRSFRDEYLQLLHRHRVSFDESYLFAPV